MGTAHAPFIYGLLLYKELPLELAPSLWYVAWVWGLTVMLGGIGLSLWRLMKKSVRSLRWGSPPLETQPERRHFLRFAVLGGLSVAASTQLLATTQRRRGYVEYVELPVSGLPPQLEGMTIGVISDVHSGPFMQRSQMEEYRRELEELQCDLIVLPGDFIINRTAEIYPFVEAFSGLKAPMGVFAVTGNHDYFSGQVERVCSEIERAGISLLRNAAVEVGRDGATITLAGIDDFYARALPDYIEHGQDPDGVLSQWERQIQRSPSPRLVLCHRPYYFEHLALLGAEGVIAGHTHGGQIVLAEVGRWALAPAAIVSPYLAGTYWSSIRSRTWMYVTRGIGTVGIPVRWNAPPEITHIRLVRRER
ncbi:MAG: metallophosphoesterase [Candidatus Kapabacteria bacterium]|nr:metallophosphoesterase [Candidatus Kapabacteria bacterium]MDW7997023.1 metallophosphoesterase [Bacteroidota bacterium]